MSGNHQIGGLASMSGINPLQSLSGSGTGIPAGVMNSMSGFLGSNTNINLAGLQSMSNLINPINNLASMSGP